jgi:hypothetical protein
MDLASKVKLKNSELMVQGIALQHKIGVRVDTTRFRSFLVTFVITPFVVGAAIRLLPGETGIIGRQLWRIVFPELRLWSLL